MIKCTLFLVLITWEQDDNALTRLDYRVFDKVTVPDISQMQWPDKWVKILKNKEVATAKYKQAMDDRFGTDTRVDVQIVCDPRFP